MKAKYLARKAASFVIRTAPAPIARGLRVLIEKVAYRLTPQIHGLPPIFHYWSNRYLRPDLERLGFSSPDDFYFKAAQRVADERQGPLRCLSVACGRCEIELNLAERLRTDGIAFHFTCIDLNAVLLRDGETQAAAAGLSDAFSFVCADMGQCGLPSASFDLVIANQCLHHFAELEAAFDFIEAALAEDGVFLTCDMIGRNGHQLWPEALAEVERIWATLPHRLRRDRTRGGHPRRYRNYDHSDVGFEGIRAQDILLMLVQRFHFEVFVAFSCLINPFVERRFGWNFDPDRDEDCSLIDAIAQRDQELLDQGVLKPTQIIAALRKHPVAALRSNTRHSPEACIRWPD